MADHPIYGNRDWVANLHADYIKAQARVEVLTQALREGCAKTQRLVQQNTAAAQFAVLEWVEAARKLVEEENG